MKLNKYLQLHIIIFIWGLTPVLGKLITLNSYDLVWYRLLFAALSLYIFMRWKKVNLKTEGKVLFKMSLMGVLVGAHWFFFYHAIKVSNVSMALAGFSTITLFASLLQPVLLNKKFYWGDLIYGLVIAVGLTIILQFEGFYVMGVIYGILAAFTGALFGIYNGKLIAKHEATKITLIEFLVAFIFITLLKIFMQNETNFIPLPVHSDIFYLLFLSIFCTTLAFTWSIEILKDFSPLTVIITNNLEPIYGVVFSLLLFGESEVMSAGFYAGAVVILLSVFTYPYVQQKFLKD
ncbi:MAG: DMT family transporter [Bacteroidota bacterium]|jgi:drug/metabolite transporter (DMT)-like permease|nr:DMT family transporter [Sphingobacteriales bacterium]